MNIIIYFFIFLAKILENSLATLRLILVANGKKLLGSILNLIISIIWVISTGLVVIDIKSDPLKLFFFALGSFLGSYLGSFIEEKIAIGSNMLFTITKPEYTNKIVESLNNHRINNYALKSENNDIVIIMIERKKRKIVLDLIHKIDNEVIVISEVARQLILNK